MANGVSRIRVYLLAENRLLRDALTRILGNKNDMEVVGASGFSSHLMQEIAETLPHILVFDSMPFALSELGLLSELRKARPELRVLMIGMDLDRELFLRAVREGAVGYLLKDASAMEISTAVRSVANSEAVCPPELCRTLFDYVAQQARCLPSFRVKQQLGLTRREQQLVELIGRGLTNKEIAQELNVAEQTVKNHVHRMLRKLGANDRLAAVEMCRIQGWVA
jgi:DNA-binding NarL/FixJ family response regulator